VQESLANVHRHAGASCAQVNLRRIGNRLHVVIRDDGIGLKAAGNAAQEARLPTGVGIAGMTARMRQLGGSLKVRSKPRGTIVHALVPITTSPAVAPERRVAAE
jgi:two-component system, NarL family, sensor kinase